MLLKVLQELGHFWVPFEIIEMVVHPQQHYSRDLYRHKERQFDLQTIVEKQRYLGGGE